MTSRCVLSNDPRKKVDKYAHHFSNEASNFPLIKPDKIKFETVDSNEDSLVQNPEGPENCACQEKAHDGIPFYHMQYLMTSQGRTRHEVPDVSTYSRRRNSNLARRPPSVEPCIFEVPSKVQKMENPFIVPQTPERGQTFLNPIPSQCFSDFDEIQNLKIRIRKLNEENYAATRAKVRFENECQKLLQENKELRLEAKRKDTELHEVRLSRDDYIRQMLMVKTENNKIIEEKIQQWKRHVHDIQQNLQKRIVVEGILKKEKEKLEKQVHDMAKKVHEEKRNNMMEKKDLNSLKSKLTDLKKQMVEKEKELFQKSTEITKLTKTLARTKGNLRIERKNNECLIHDLNECRTTMTELLHNFGKSNSCLNKMMEMNRNLMNKMKVLKQTGFLQEDDLGNLQDSFSRGITTDEQGNQNEADVENTEDYSVIAALDMIDEPLEPSETERNIIDENIDYLEGYIREERQKTKEDLLTSLGF